MSQNIEKQENNKKRDGFGSRWGFIMACIGSAVGMGNIWLFPYRVGQLGGAAFLIPYFIFVALIGYTGVIGEMSFGRAMKTGPLGAFEKAFKMRGLKGGTAIGLIPVIGSMGIAIGYSVVVGWILRYLWGSFSGEMFAAESAGAYFGPFASNYGSIPWHIAALVATFVLMSFGVKNGIEKINKIMMPAFFFMFVFLAIKIFTLPGADRGYTYLLHPEWSALLNPKTWIYAMGQAFFSLSLAGSGTVVYGSYLSDKEDIVNSAKNVAIFDTLAAVLAAVVIIPAVFAYDLEMGAGPGLMFVTLPTVFRNMPFGRVVAVVFFIAVFFAGITSLMNLFETPVEALQQRLGFSRVKAIIAVGIVAFAVGIFLEGDYLSGWMDMVSIYIIPTGALLAGITFFWICGEKFAREQAQLGCPKKIGRWFEPMTKYVFCGVALAVLVMSILIPGGIG
ncbi:MAG: sodium-dependent transporter [Oscillospiraceae bacterium]